MPASFAFHPSPARFRSILWLCGALLGSVAASARAAPAADASLRATTIHILGQFNGWNDGLWWSDPGMTQAAPTVWVDSVAIFPRFTEPGVQEFKFVTDASWDVPGDYTFCQDRWEEYGQLSGPVCLSTDGYYFNLPMFATSPGTYEFTLDESARWYAAAQVEVYSAIIRGRVQLVSRGADFPVASASVYASGDTLRLASSPSDPGDGTFSVPELDGGTYDLRLSANGYLPVEISGVSLSDGGSVDVGAVMLEPGCASTVSFLQVLGDFNGWDGGAPFMAQLAPCVWTDTLEVAQGCHFLKFRTNAIWGDDYGSCVGEDPNCLVPMAGNVCVVNGPNALGKIEFPVTTTYVFHLDERSMTYGIHELPTPIRASSWGSIKARYR